MDQRDFDKRGTLSRGRLTHDRRRAEILRSAELQFAETGLRSTTTTALANAADISEAVLYRHFSTKQKLFEEVVERNVERRLATVEKRFSSIPNLPPLECVERLGEATIMACAGLDGNASVMAWALMEMPHFAKEVYRREIGATEAMWDNELARRFPESPLRARLAIHLAPYAVHACMAFGLWLAALRHQPATAAAHANQYAEGIANAARVILETPAGPPEMSGCTDLIETAGLR